MSTTAEKIAEYKRRIEVMEAYDRGEEVQHSHAGRGDWTDFTNTTPSWLWHGVNEYRIKPKPREWWVNIYQGRQCWHSTKESAGTFPTADLIECRHVIEVP